MAEPIVTFTTKPTPVTDRGGAILGYRVAATLVMPNGTMTQEVGFARTERPPNGREAMGDHAPHPNALLGARREAMKDAVKRCRRTAGC